MTSFNPYLGSGLRNRTISKLIPSYLSQMPSAEFHRNSSASFWDNRPTEKNKHNPGKSTVFRIPNRECDADWSRKVSLIFLPSRKPSTDKNASKSVHEIPSYPAQTDRQIHTQTDSIARPSRLMWKPVFNFLSDRQMYIYPPSADNMYKLVLRLLILQTRWPPTEAHGQAYCIRGC